MSDEHEAEPHVHGPHCNHGHHHHAVEPARKEQLPGRNDPCWCGSGTKYKKCHLKSDQG